MKLWNHSDHIVFETRNRLHFQMKMVFPSIFGPRVNTVVINSLDKGNGGKCTDVGTGDSRHMRSLPSCCFTNAWDRRRVF